MKWIHKLISKINNTKMRKKLILTFVLIGALPMLILGIFAYSQTRKLLLEQEKSNLKDFLEQSKMSVENHISIYNNLSDYIAYNQTISNTLSYNYDSYYDMYKQFTNTLDPMLSSVKYFNQEEVKTLTIYAENNIVKHDTTLAPLSEIENEPWFNDVLKLSSRNIKWIVDKNKKEVISVRNMPFLESNDINGILYISVDYDKLFESFFHMNTDNYGLIITDDTGKEIFKYNNFDKFNSNMILDTINLEEEIQKYNDGISAYTIVSDDTYTGWNIVLYKPNRAMNKSMFPLMMITIIVTMTCIAISIYLAAFLSKKLVSDIEKLTDNMVEVESGNLVITVKSEADDEIGNLIRGFSRMIDKIKLLILENYEGEIAQKESEMRALQAQINPHFLYNSLSLINWKAIETNQQDISRLTLLLSTFYRTALNKGNNVLSIKDEIKNVSSYIDIQLMMHDNDFEVEFDVEEEILDYATLNLILQPLIENAIDHGIDLKTEGKGKIVINGYQDDELITLVVSDNGIGMDDEKAKAILSNQSKGYGVRNVNERIKLFFGTKYGLVVNSVEGVGTKIMLIFPKIKL